MLAIKNIYHLFRLLKVAFITKYILLPFCLRTLCLYQCIFCWYLRLPGFSVFQVNKFEVYSSNIPVITGEHYQSNFIEITFRHWLPLVNLLHIFRRPFPKNTSGMLLLILSLKPRRNKKFLHYHLITKTV